MDEKTYNEKLKQIEADYDAAKKGLYKEFADSNRIYNLGDIIESNVPEIIIVEKFGSYKSFGLPEPVYIGHILKKDLTPRKDKNIGHIYGNYGTKLIKRKES